MTIQVGKPVTGQNLIGRDSEVDLIGRMLDEGRSVVLVAPRRYGKTSVLLEVLERRRKRGDFTAFIDLFSIPDLMHLSAEIARTVMENKKIHFTLYQLQHGITELMRNVQFRQEINQYEYILGFGQRNYDEWLLLKESLQLMESFAAKNKKKLIGFFDEFGDVKKLDGDRIVKLFRSELQIQKNTTCMFAGSYESVMNSIFVTRSAPFYRFARIIRLSRIDPETFRNHLRGIFSEQNLKGGDDLSAQIVSFTQGHPYYTSLMAQLAVIYHFSGTMRDLAEIAIEAEGNYLEKSWSEISSKSQEKAVILAIAEDSDTLLYQQLDYRKINVARVLKKLKEAGLVESTSHGHQLTDPLLAWWIRQKVLKLP